MNVFGMGWQEIMVIMVAALIIFGPGRLPEVAGQVGRWVRDFRRMTTELTAEFERTAGVQELKSAVQGELSGMKSEVSAVTSSVKRDLNAAASTVNSTVASATSSATKKPTTVSSATKPAAKPTSSTSAAKSPATSASGTMSTPVQPLPRASKRDPLADVSFLEEVAPAPVSNGNAPAARSDAERATQPAAASAVSAATASNGAAKGLAEDQRDALARARQRRLAAGYNRRQG